MKTQIDRRQLIGALGLSASADVMLAKPIQRLAPEMFAERLASGLNLRPALCEAFARRAEMVLGGGAGLLWNAADAATVQIEEEKTYVRRWSIDRRRHDAIAPFVAVASAEALIQIRLRPIAFGWRGSCQIGEAHANLFQRANGSIFMVARGQQDASYRKLTIDFAT